MPRHPRRLLRLDARGGRGERREWDPGGGQDADGSVDGNRSRTTTRTAAPILPATFPTRAWTRRSRAAPTRKRVRAATRRQRRTAAQCGAGLDGPVQPAERRGTPPSATAARARSSAASTATSTATASRPTAARFRRQRSQQLPHLRTPVQRAERRAGLRGGRVLDAHVQPGLRRLQQQGVGRLRDEHHDGDELRHVRLRLRHRERHAVVCRGGRRRGRRRPRRLLLRVHRPYAALPHERRQAPAATSTRRPTTTTAARAATPAPSGRRARTERAPATRAPARSGAAIPTAGACVTASTTACGIRRERLRRVRHGTALRRHQRRVRLRRDLVPERVLQRQHVHHRAGRPRHPVRQGGRGVLGLHEDEPRVLVRHDAVPVHADVVRGRVLQYAAPRVRPRGRERRTRASAARAATPAASARPVRPAPAEGASAAAARATGAAAGAPASCRTAAPPPAARTAASARRAVRTRSAMRKGSASATRTPARTAAAPRPSEARASRPSSPPPAGAAERSAPGLHERQPGVRAAPVGRAPTRARATRTSCKNGCCTAGTRASRYGAESPTQCGAAGALCGGCGQGTYCNGSGVCTCDSTKCGGCCTAAPRHVPRVHGYGSCGDQGGGVRHLHRSGQSCNAAGQCQCDGSSCGRGAARRSSAGTCLSGKRERRLRRRRRHLLDLRGRLGDRLQRRPVRVRHHVGLRGLLLVGDDVRGGHGVRRVRRRWQHVRAVRDRPALRHLGGRHHGRVLLCDSTSCAGGCCTATANGTCVGVRERGDDPVARYTGALCAPCPSGQACNTAHGPLRVHVGGRAGRARPAAATPAATAETSGPSTCGTLGAACQNCTQNGVSCVNNQCQQILTVTVSPSGERHGQRDRGRASPTARRTARRRTPTARRSRSRPDAVARVRRSPAGRAPAPGSVAARSA